MLLEWIVISILSLALVGILIYVSQQKKGGKSPTWIPVVEQKNSQMKVCPLCKTPLEKGEKVHSELFPGKEDKMMHIHGCPYCDSRKEGSSIRRFCPYCKEPLSGEDYVIARVFMKPDKTYVHVLGCTRCRLNR